MEWREGGVRERKVDCRRTQERPRQGLAEHHIWHGTGGIKHSDRAKQNNKANKWRFYGLFWGVEDRDGGVGWQQGPLEGEEAPAGVWSSAGWAIRACAGGRLVTGLPLAPKQIARLSLRLQNTLLSSILYCSWCLHLAIFLPKCSSGILSSSVFSPLPFRHALLQHGATLMPPCQFRPRAPASGRALSRSMMLCITLYFYDILIKI